MKAQVTFVLDGAVYVSKATDEMSVFDMKTAIYNGIADMTKFEMELDDDDGYLVIGSESLKRGVFLIKEVV